jgi:hypothetical protein
MIRVAVFVALALGGGVAAATAQPTALVVRGDYQMGAFRVNMSLGDAQRIFGAPLSKSVTLGVCRVDWPGLVMQFTGCRRSSFFVRFVGESRRWRTAKGLAVGAPVSTIRKLYPRSKPTSVGGRERWVLVVRPKSRPTAFALTANGRVAALVVNRGHRVYFR